MLLNIRFPSDDQLNDDDGTQTLASLNSAEVLSGKKMNINDKAKDHQGPQNLYQQSYEMSKNAKNSRIDSSMIDSAFTDELTVQRKQKNAEEDAKK